MPFKNKPNFKSNSYDEGLESLRAVLESQNQQMLAQQQEQQPFVANFTQEDLGTPTPDEDITQFEVDPLTMPWSTEARKKREYEIMGMTTEEQQEKQRIATNQTEIENNTISLEEQEGYAFLQAIRQIESSGNYNPGNKGNMTGAYQFDWSEWGDEIQREVGANREQFLNSPELQDKFFNEWYKPNVLEKESEGYLDAFKSVYPNATQDDLMAAWHFAGAGNIRKGLKNGNLNQWTDGNGKTIGTYLDRMHNVNIAEHNTKAPINENIIPDEGVDMDLHPELMTKLDILQKRLGMPIYMKSGHRDAKRNEKAGGAKNSSHMRKLAGDIDFERMGKAKDIEFKKRFIREASDVGFLGIGVYNNNIHLDIDGSLGRRAWGPNHHKESVPLWAQNDIAYHNQNKK